MKFLAMLRDSLRETLDVKVFYFLVGLSLLIVLLMFSVVYRPVSLKTQMDSNLSWVNWALRMQSEGAKTPAHMEVEIQNFEQLSHPDQPWLSEYRFDYTVTLSIGDDQTKLSEADKKALKEVRDQLKERLSADMLRNNFSRDLFSEVTVAAIPPRQALPPNTVEIRYEINGKGTRMKSRKEWFHETRLFFGLVKIPLIGPRPLDDTITVIVKNIIGGIGGAFTLLMGIIITASFLPNMLAKGTVDLLIVKPIHRPTLFFYKFLGGLLFMLLNTSIIMIGLYLALGVQAGTWLNSLFLCILVYTFQFAIFYSVMAVFAVLTRNTIVCILMALLTWGLLLGVGVARYGFVDYPRQNNMEPSKAALVFDAIASVLPRYKDLDWLVDRELREELIRPVPQNPPSKDDTKAYEEYQRHEKLATKLYERQKEELQKLYGPYNWATAILVSTLFIAAMLGFACWRFAVKDY